MRHDECLDASGRSDKVRFDAVTKRAIAPASDAIARIAVGAVGFMAPRAVKVVAARDASAMPAPRARRNAAC
ncbi:hypothetical protein ACS0ZG_36795 [Burkholderia gladioli]|uniref:hypothetical protein n=1 Tax=Burkholderia gladioli TaxID=28095 RepID=UPI00163FEE61|nr:hypothetical protein [Burkholderia gladioli]MDA0570368.1 hypothetical protein [Burkholderia gladioli]MDA0598572.1 hypothetical protein [Burkholderia gladioli]